ncbi:MAG: WVD2 family protein [Polyangiaceae bacterium]|nr:WVD2 family protein [Polyangiaceae bacterium]
MLHSNARVLSGSISTIIALLLLSGCSSQVFGHYHAPEYQDPPAYPPPSVSRAEQEQRHAERRAAMEEAKRQRAAETEARERAIFDELDVMRRDIAATKDVVNKARPFAQKVVEASHTELARSRKVDMAPLYAEAAQYLESAIRQSPSIETFDTLAGLPPGEATDRALLAACHRVRHLVQGDEVLDFTGTCLDGAGGDAKKLKWPNAQRDVAAYLKEENERALAAAVTAKKAQEKQAKAERYVAAAVFAAGRCRFGNCLKDGWTARTAEGDVDVSCSFSNCFKDGWTARFPDGSQATTRCSFSDCTKDGWSTRFPDGTEATTRCSFSNCLKDGWSTDLPGGGTATTRCSFSDCSTNGWETSLPDGQSIRCRCNFNKCFEDGATCE